MTLQSQRKTGFTVFQVNWPFKSLFNVLINCNHVEIKPSEIEKYNWNSLSYVI